MVGIWSAINPHDYFTWWLESVPVIITLPILIITYKRFQFSNMVYCSIGIHCLILLIGGHYTYAEMPAFNWLRDTFGLSRNYYDRLGHFAQGAIPALVLRELLIRTSPLKSGKWLAAIIIFCCLGISAVYEILEWAASATTGEAADAFLGTQGDVWDTQKDMLIAGIGAAFSVIFLSSLHNNSLQKLRQ